MKTPELNKSFQALLNRAIKKFMQHKNSQKAKKLVFNSRNIGSPLDDMTREDIYTD